MSYELMDETISICDVVDDITSEDTQFIEVETEEQNLKFYVLIDERRKACAIVYDAPSEDTQFIEMETEEQALEVLGKIWTGIEFITSEAEENIDALELKEKVDYLTTLIELQGGLI